MAEFMAVSDSVLSSELQGDLTCTIMCHSKI